MKTERHLLALSDGYRLGKYVIEGVLGSGGFGITYLAEDTSLGRRVAIKELLPGDFATRVGESTVSPKGRETDRENLEWARTRFIEEGKVLAACPHPNVVEVYESFAANGTAYLVTRYEEGQDLERWLRGLGRAPTEAELVAILWPLLSGLERVHQAGFLHRDLKPENIYLTRGGRPVLLDFGSARQAIGGRSRMLTAVITAGYAPFEQYHEGGKQGPWTDIYALGAVMHRAITGQKPPEAAARMMGNDPYKSLAATQANRYSAALLKGLDQALRVKAPERPQSIAQWRTLLGEKAPSQSLAQPKRLPVVALAVVGLAIALVGGSATIWFAMRGDADLTVARTTPSATPTPTPLATPASTPTPPPTPLATPETMGEALAASNRGDSDMAKDEYDQAIIDYTEAIRLNPNDANAFCGRGLAYYDKKQYDQAIDDYSEAIGLKPDFAVAYYDRGLAYDDNKAYDKAISDYTEAIRLKPDDADSYCARGWAFHGQREYDKAISDYNDAIRLNPNFALAYNDRGLAYYNKNDNDQAISDYSDAIRLNPNFAFPYNNRGLVYYSKKDYNKAISDFTEAIRINPNYFFAYYDRGLSYDHIREYDKAISDYTEAIRLKEDADAYCARGWAFYEQKEYTKAINDYNEAIRLNPNFALAYTDRGTAYQKLGKLDKAKADFAKAAQLQ